MVIARFNKNFLHTRSSRGIVRDYAMTTISGTHDPIVQPVSDYNILDRMVRNDEIISTAFDTTVDVLSRNGWDFISTDLEKEFGPIFGLTKDNLERLTDLVFDDLVKGLRVYWK